MKPLIDEINEDLDKFNRPVSQAFRNIRDDISDSVSDSMAERGKQGGKYKKPRKKGCLWTVIKWYLILSAISVLLTECGANETVRVENEVQTTMQVSDIEQNAETPESQEVQAVDTSVQIETAEYHQLGFIAKQVEYAVECNIELHRFSNEESKLSDWLVNPSKDVFYVETDNIFGADQYKRTEGYEGYLYCGELKDNRPDGYGILFVAPERCETFLTFDNHGYVISYVGQFVDGRFDGFGLKFAESENGHAFVLNLCPYNESTSENLEYFLTWSNYVEYFGEFSEGYKDGLGNTFVLSDFYIGSFENALNEIDLDNPSFSIDVGEYKKDELNGANKQYIGGHLFYDGESKAGMLDGYGVLYYYGTDVPQYEGEFKRDMRHGTGTSYSEAGEIVYQGEWKNDDYA